MEMDKKVFEIEELVKSKGYKLTHSRKVIIRLFVETEEHHKPEEVYQLTKEKGISLPTVYRTIDIFKRIGIIKEITIHNDRFYELNIYSQKKLHIHFNCHKCGQIKEYSDRITFRKMIQQRDYLEAVYKDNIEDITIVMTGICKNCNGKT